MNWSEAIILFKYPSRSRPQKFKEGLLSILENLNKPHAAKIHFTIDEDDPQLNNYLKVIDETMGRYPDVDYVVDVGLSKNKIDAVNRGMDKAAYFDILICMSDDMRFIQKGFDDTIRIDFACSAHKDDMVLHYNDGNQKSNCMTMSIMGRKYFNRRKYIYHPEYESVECDLEAQEEANMLNRYAYMGDERRIVDHLHPSFNKAQYDEQYVKTENYEVHNRDKSTRAKRYARNYDLIKTESGWDTPKNEEEMEQEDAAVPQDYTSIDAMNDLVRKAEKTKKLREKLAKKLSEAKELSGQITALGLVKIEVGVTETTLK